MSLVWFELSLTWNTVQVEEDRAAGSLQTCTGGQSPHCDICRFFTCTWWQIANEEAGKILSDAVHHNGGGIYHAPWRVRRKWGQRLGPIPGSMSVWAPCGGLLRWALIVTNTPDSLTLEDPGVLWYQHYIGSFEQLKWYISICFLI